MNGCKNLNICTVTDEGGLKGTCWKILHNAECKMLRWKLNGCKNLNFGTVTDGEGGKERVEKCCIVLSVKC